jgi:hypothetical protein
MVSCALHQVIWYTIKKTTRKGKMNTRKAATNNNSSPFEESAHRGIVDSIFCGIHTFKFIDHSKQDGKDLMSSFPMTRMEAVGPSEIGVQPAADGPEAASSK